MDSQRCIGLEHRCDDTKRRFSFLGFLSLPPLEPRDSPKWLSLKFLENLGRVSFAFSRCEATFQYNSSKKLQQPCINCVSQTHGSRPTSKYSSIAQGASQHPSFTSSTNIASP